MLPPNIVQGQLSLRSFVKLCVIASIGTLPVMAVYCGVLLLIYLVRGHHPAQLNDAFVLVLWPLLLLRVVADTVGIVLSGLFMGLCGYPFYAWLCRRRNGVILKGKFEVL